MAIKSSNDKLNTTIRKDQKLKLIELCEKRNINLSKLCIEILDVYFNSLMKNDSPIVTYEIHSNKNTERLTITVDKLANAFYKILKEESDKNQKDEN